MNWKAKWVWIEGEESPNNFWLAARRVIDIQNDIKEARLYITADSRYVVWFNGKRLGQGPVRGWPWNWSYDTYDVKGILCPGKNVIFVLVLHYGVSNFQYIQTRAGLLAQLDIITAKGKKISVGTDRTWKGISNPSYDRKTMRISCQQAWVEHFHAKKTDGWHSVDFNHKAWENLKEIGEVGISPWEKLSPRDIPFLTEEPVYPVRILRHRVVKSLNQHFAFDLRPNLIPGDRTSNPGTLSGFAVTVLHSPKPVKGKIIYPEMEWTNIAGSIRINGRNCPWRGENKFDTVGRYAECNLKKGDNLIIWNVCGTYHNWHLLFSLDIPFKANLRPPLSKETKFRLATLGPIEKTDKETFDQIWQARKESEFRPYKKILKNISASDEVSANIFAQTTQAEETKEEARISHPEYLCIPNEDTTTIYPPRSGDAEILIDFGREIVGFLEFELETEREVILDFNCFESIQEGKIDFTWGLQNVLRYTTREGAQFYHSVIRRGFRYVLLVVRFPKGYKRPLKVKFLRCLLNTYPVIERGEFVSNDTRLNHIWKMGRYTTRLCSEDTFVDCPAYEQTFWVGDSRNEAAVNHVAFGEYTLSSRSIVLAAESLKRSLLVESQVPSGWQDVLTAWSLLWVLACEEFYQITGDLKFIKKVYPSIARQNRNLEKMLLNGLISINAWNMLDWAPMDTPRDARAITHQNAWYVESLRRSARLSSVLGKKTDAKKWLETAMRVKEAINKKLWDGKNKAYVDCIRSDSTKSPVISQQTNTIVFLCDCATPRRRQILKNYIATAPANFVKIGSPFMMFFTFEALAKLGQFEKILALSRKYWGFMLDNDATTCWEIFPGYYPNKQWTRSHCHAWSAAPTYFLSTYQLGIMPEEPGFRKARIAPKPAGLKWVRGSMPTPYGQIKLDWMNQKGAFKIEVSLPGSVSGKVLLPDFISRKAKLEISGDIIKKPIFSNDNWQVWLKEKGRIVITARY